MNTYHEICIAGGGPAGIATALSLLNRGIKSTILEAGPNIRPKVGETLPPNVMPILRALGIEQLLEDPAHAPCYGNSWIWGNNEAQEKHFMMHTGGNGWHLQRDLFETALLELAEKRGIKVIRNAKVMQVEQQTDGNWKLELKIDGSSQTFESQFLVDATGRNSKIARCLGIERRQYDHLIGIVARFKTDENIILSGQTHIEAVENGWWYAAALTNGEIVTAFMTDAHLLPKEMQNIAGYWKALLQAKSISNLFSSEFEPDQSTSLHIQSAETSFLETSCGNNWLAVGDAAFAYDPVSSYGITSALGAGCYAGHAIADHLNGEEEALPAYRFVVEKAFADYLPLWDHQYALEKRWTESDFWKGRG